MGEIITRYLPDMKYGEWLQKLNEAQRDFCSESRCLRQTSDIILDPAEVCYDKPANMQQILSVRYLDDNDLVVTTDKAYIAMQGDEITLTDYKFDTLSAPPAAAAKLQLYGVGIPEAMATLSSVPEIDSRHHMALVARVIEFGLMADPERIQQAVVWHRIWQDSIRKAKKEANSGGNLTGTNISLKGY